MVRAIICGSVIVTMTELKIKIPEDLKRKMEKFGVDWSTPSNTERHRATSLLPKYTVYP